MKKVYEVLQWLNEHQIQFNLMLLDEESGDLIIVTLKQSFEVYNDGHEVRLYVTHDEFKISDMENMF